MSLWKGKRSWKMTKTDVTGNCAAINVISFSYNFLCLSLQLNFSFPLLCIAPIILQWNNKNSLKRPSQMWLWKDYTTSSKETISVKMIQVVDWIQSCLSGHELLLTWRKNTQNNSKPLKVDPKTKNIYEFLEINFENIYRHQYLLIATIIHGILHGWFPFGISQ